jgi:hypothetical protein
MQTRQSQDVGEAWAILLGGASMAAGIVQRYGDTDSTFAEVCFYKGPGKL